MADIDSLLEDYATKPVPESATYGGARIGFVLGGIGVALPGLLSGAEVGLALGYRDSAIAFVLAGVIVAGLAVVTGWVGMRSRLSTYMILRFAFGVVGARFVNLSFAVAQFGWFGVNAYFFGQAAESVGQGALGLDWPSYIYIIAGGVLMTAATIFGFKALDKLALFVFPVMATTLAFMVARSFGLDNAPGLLSIAGAGGMTMGQAVTVLAGGIIVGVLLVPDLTRYARGPIDVLIAVVIALAIIEPVVHFASSGAAILLQETDPLAILLALGFGAYSFFFLVMASVSTNAVNLYGTGLAMTSIFPKIPAWRFVVMTGVFGTVLAILNIDEVFIDFLVWQSVIFSSVLGVYVVDFFIVRRGVYHLDDLDGAPGIIWPSFIAWAAGAAVAAATYQGVITLTTVSNLDGAIVGALVYAVLRGRADPGSVKAAANLDLTTEGR